jgi:hypothetical protein
LTPHSLGPIIAGTANGLGMSDPDRNRSIRRMSWIVFILVALAWLISIIFVRPVPARDAPPTITRSL